MAPPQNKVDEQIQKLSVRVELLPNWKRATYAAACATRLLPIYDSFCLDSGWQPVGSLSSLVATLWQLCASTGEVAQVATESIQRVKRMPVLRDEDYDQPEADAAGTTVALINAGYGQLCPAERTGVDLAFMAVEPIQHAVCEAVLGYVDGPIDSASAATILSDERMVFEFAAQERVVSMLEQVVTHDPEDIQEVAEKEAWTSARLLKT